MFRTFLHFDFDTLHVSYTSMKKEPEVEKESVVACFMLLCV